METIYYYDNKEYKDIELSVVLLREYLGKYYNSVDKAKTVIRNNKERLDILAKSLGKQNIEFFNLYFLRELFVPSNKNISRPLAKVHYDIFNELNNLLINDKTNREEFILPRGVGKSTVVNTSVAVWSSVYQISKYTVVIGKTDKLMEEFIQEVRACLGYEKIKAVFGDLINTKRFTVNKEELELTNRTKVQGFTWGGTIRGAKYHGQRPQVIIVDDVLKEDDILSDNAKEKTVNKLYKEILPAGDKAKVIKGKKQGIDTKFIVIGTPLAADDLVNTVRQDSTFKVFRKAVVDFDIDDYVENSKLWQEYRTILMNSKDENRVDNAKNFYYDHEEEMKFSTLWEGKYNPCELINDYFTKRLSFMQELMCDCESVGDIWVKSIAKIPSIEMESKKFEKTILSIDQGASNTSKSDFTAFTVLGKSNGFYCVREGTLKKFDSKTEFDRYIDFTIMLLLKWEDITHVVLEKNVYKGVDATRIEEAIAKDIRLRQRHIEVITVYNTQNKDQRIMTITDKINSGQVLFNENDVEYNKQVQDFRGQKFTVHDDAIDSLEMAINNIDQIKLKKKASIKVISLAGIM